MKIIVDNKIPYIKEAIERIFEEVVYLPGKDFTPENVRDADALIIRTRTLCNRELLKESRVKFIATATIGFDHIDTDYCLSAGITWTNAPGCNSASVAQYIESSFALLKLTQGMKPEKTTLGIIGVGNVGSKVAEMAQQQGMRVLLNDPPREKEEGGNAFCSLTQIARECDIITFHVPLNRGGEYNTYHLADVSFFDSLQRNPTIINTSRGEVIETNAILSVLKSEKITHAIIDVWEHEPEIDRTLLQKSFIGTPHIAGYSADGKANATRKSLDALCRYFKIDATYAIVPPAPLEKQIDTSNSDNTLLEIYNPQQDSEALKAHPELFEKLRGDYPLRREKTAYNIR